MLCAGTGWFTVRGSRVPDSQKATQTQVKKGASCHNAYDRPRWTSVNLGPRKSGYSISHYHMGPCTDMDRKTSAISLLMRRPALLLNTAPLFCGGK